MSRSEEASVDVANPIEDVASPVKDVAGPLPSPAPDITPPSQAPTIAPAPPAVPRYLTDTYSWAYLSRLGTRVFDRQPVVSAILWGNARRLITEVIKELQPGWHVMQPAAVYGSFSRDVAVLLGPRGRLEVSDVAPIQVALTRRKLADLPQARVDQVDACTPGRGPYDAVTCFFLLHEVPADTKRRIVDALLGAVKPGGKVIFVDYHRTVALHPLRPVMRLVFDLLEPFARDLCAAEIRDLAAAPEAFTWTKQTYFGGLYQKVIASRNS